MTSPADMRVKATALGDSDFERFLPDCERLVELGVRERERRQDPDAVRVDAGLEQEEAAFRGFVGDGGGERGRRLLRLGILDELDCEHRPEAADVSDLREA